MIKTILFFVSEDWYFCSHRLPIARSAKQAGFNVVVVTRVREHGEKIVSEGLVLAPLELERSGMNPLGEIQIIFKLIQIYRKHRPIIVHHIALKPILYGSVAASIVRIPFVINALTGMGSVFTNTQKGFMVFVKLAVSRMMRIVLNGHNRYVIVQNRFDAEFLKKEMGLTSHSISIIRGSGVDTLKFHITSEPPGPIRVTMVSRMLWDKGVAELVSAAQILKEREIPCVVTLVGEPDFENPTAISAEKIKEWMESGDVEYWGKVNDIPAVWDKSHIAVLPSYREGLPKSLLEAASCGRPIVATDIPGCRELVKNGINGLLFQVKNAIALAESIEILVKDSELRSKMGKEGRKSVVSSFSEEIIAIQTLSLYKDILDKR